MNTITEEDSSSMLEDLGSYVINNVKGFGASVIFLIQSWVCLFTPPYRPRLILQQIKSVGVDSTLVIALIGLFTGAVLAVQGEYTLSQFGATAFTGSAVALSLIRELGPVLTALMLIGRAGSAMTAELGIMKITEQTDALYSMAINPLRYLMAPRLITGLIVMPLLSSIFIVVGIGGGYLVGVSVLDLSAGTFMNQIIKSVDSTDVYSGLIKSFAFGLIFGWVCCYKGYTCGFGARGVNMATTKAVVTASVAVLVVDYFLTSILTRLFF